MNAIGTRTRAGASFCTRRILYTCDPQPAVIDDAEREALDTLSNVIDFLLIAISFVIQKFKELGHYKMDVPIFSALRKLVSSGRDFTLFNCFSLILDIPTSILYKIAVGKALPKLAGRLTKNTFKQFMEGDASLDKSLVRDINEVGGAVAASAATIFLVLKLITYVTDELTIMDAEADDGTIETRKVMVGGEAGHVIDAAKMFFNIVGLVISWPLHHEHDQALHWWIWGLDCNNGLVMAIGNIVSWTTHIPHVEIERSFGTYEALTGIARYVLEIIIDVHEYDLPKGDPDKHDDQVTRNIIEQTTGIVGEIAWGVAAVTDKIQPEISYPALSVFGVATAIGVSFKVVSFMVWKGEQKQKKPEMLALEEKTERLALKENKSIECADEEWVKEQEELLDGDVD
ncbi:hypothetical protein OEA41_005966 [Lepraria neglecta]|uniref:Uncharacterized protein n=1 Tax=Lepraria neglecta TaxID=209136 RepID=A0AAD9ZAC3_9LECA|nr:hypothetical protein OEA41_005966 [Lepraria neglecta]